jgi:hypothetical protein
MKSKLAVEPDAGLKSEPVKENQDLGFNPA